MGNEKHLTSLHASFVILQQPSSGQVIHLKQKQATPVSTKAFDKRKLEHVRVHQKAVNIKHNSYKQEISQQCQIHKNPKPKGVAVVKEKERVLYKHVHESVRREEHAVVQRGKDVFMERKLMVGHRERETKIEKASLLFDNRKLGVKPRVTTLSIK